jgi:hypothetical protein
MPQVCAPGEPYNGSSKGESPWLRHYVGGGVRDPDVTPGDRQGVEPIGNELLVNEFIFAESF